MVSLFSGESEADKRDYGFAFAALKSSLYLAKVLAATGRLSPLDAKAHSQQVRDGLEIVPEKYLPTAGRQAVEETLGQIERLAEHLFNSYRE